MPDLNAHRVRPVINTSYAVVDLTGDSASGRAEDATLPEVNRAVHSDEPL